MVAELKSYLRESVGLRQKLLPDFSPGKKNWFRLNDLITLVLLIWKWMSLFLKKNYLWTCWGWLSPRDWIEALKKSVLLKLPARKLEARFVLRGFFLLLIISINLPYDLAPNAIFISGLLLLSATWKCYMNYKMDMWHRWPPTCCLS